MVKILKDQGQEEESEEEMDSDDQYVPEDDQIEEEDDFQEPQNLYSDLAPTESKPSYEDLKSGISSLISGAQTVEQPQQLY